MEEDMGIKHRTIPENPKERILIYGVFPDDKRGDDRPTYCWWASKYLIEQYPCTGDLIKVPIEKQTEEGIPYTVFYQAYVTDIKNWNPGDYEPTAIARSLYEGDRYQDFEWEVVE